MFGRRCVSRASAFSVKVSSSRLQGRHDATCSKTSEVRLSIVFNDEGVAVGDWSDRDCDSLRLIAIRHRVLTNYIK